MNTRKEIVIHAREKRMVVTDFSTERMKICDACPMMMRSRLVGKTCGIFLAPVEGETCGCILAVKTKLKSFHCPQNKW